MTIYWDALLNGLAICLHHRSFGENFRHGHGNTQGTWTRIIHAVPSDHDGWTWMNIRKGWNPAFCSKNKPQKKISIWPAVFSNAERPKTGEWQGGGFLVVWPREGYSKHLNGVLAWHNLTSLNVKTKPARKKNNFPVRNSPWFWFIFETMSQLGTHGNSIGSFNDSSGWAMSCCSAFCMSSARWSPTCCQERSRWYGYSNNVWWGLIWINGD